MAVSTGASARASSSVLASMTPEVVICSMTSSADAPMMAIWISIRAQRLNALTVALARPARNQALNTSVLARSQRRRSAGSIPSACTTSALCAAESATLPAARACWWMSRIGVRVNRSFK
jgi:hypothetical protein